MFHDNLSVCITLIQHPHCSLRILCCRAAYLWRNSANSSLHQTSQAMSWVLHKPCGFQITKWPNGSKLFISVKQCRFTGSSLVGTSVHHLPLLLPQFTVLHVYREEGVCCLLHVFADTAPVVPLPLPVCLCYF